MASTYLSWTPSSTETSPYIKTISVWLKRANPSNEHVICSAKVSERQFFRFETSGELTLRSLTIGELYQVTTNAKFRDVNGWYHIVLAYDSTQGTASNRVKMYVNGEQVTSFSTASYPASNITFDFGRSGYPIHIGNDSEQTTPYYDGLMSHFHFIDGTAYQASDFGETDSTSGVWKPKTAPSVTYGTNGFFLKFANSASLGTDSSGNGNNFTVNGSGTQTLDTPSNVYATLNPLLQSGVGTFTNGNLTHSSSSGVKHTVSTLGMTTGKWYAEAKYIGGANYNGVGFVTEPIFATTSAWYASPYNATLTYTNVYNNSTSYGSFATPSTGDIIGMAIDLDNGYMYWSNNGVWGNSGVPTSGATGTGGIATSLIGTLGSSTFFFATEQDATPGTRTADWNFGNGYFGTTVIASPNSDGAGEGKFAYAPPTGYYALNTKNIKTYG